jgi:4-hydroxyacetophenone monooxygenase
VRNGCSPLLDRMTHRPPASVVSEAELRAHAAVTETRHLLLAAVHVTGDVSLLDRFAHRLPRTAAGRQMLFGGKDVDGDPPELREELLAILCSVLTREDQPPYLHPDDRGVFERLAEVAIGGPVDSSQMPMCMEQAGFVPDRHVVPAMTAPPKSLDLAVLGAGMTGLDAAVKASVRGFECTVYEMEAGIGGLWWSQTYPGVGVDTPSLYYSLSFEMTPEWSKYYPLGAEYRAYLHRLAAKYDVAGIRCNSKVLRMEWLEAEALWELTILDTADESTRTERHAAVLTGAGHLNRPKWPNIPGRERFTGEQLHTGRWRDVDVDGKRVAVIGVGAAGIQVVGALAPTVGHMSVFQRQPHWVAPNELPDNGNVSASERWLRRHLPYYMHWSRFQTFYLANSLSYEMNVVDLEWMKTHPLSISAANEELTQLCQRYINDTFGEGSELARKLTPDYPFGGKRPIRDPGALEPGGYYWAYLQPHVDLVGDEIVEIVPEGIVTADGTIHEVDVIVWATGMTLDFLSTIEIVGRDGVRLGDVWAGNNPSSYLGGTVPGFPNLFINDGPNTGVATGGGGHNFMSETVNHYVFECLQLMVERGAGTIEVTREAHDRHNERIEREMAGLIWAHERTAHTYYRNAAGRVILPSPFTANEYWTMSRQPDESAFVLGDRVVLEDAVPDSLRR